MTLLEKYYYEHMEIDTPKAVNDITELLEPILNKNLLLKIDELLSDVIVDSGLQGFKQGFGTSVLITKSKEVV